MNELPSRTLCVPVLGQSLEVAWHEFPSSADTILLLHEALGSVAYWKDFPQKLRLATGANVLLYSRAGHGESAGPLPARNREHYLREAEEVIPALLKHFGIEQPVVYGHSEGASLAVLYAATTQQAKKLVLESPFVIAAESSRRYIMDMAAQYQGSHLQQRLANYHRDADAVFASWIAGVQGMRDKESPIGTFLPLVKCPVLVLQGAEDEFGTARHLDALLSALPDVQHEAFPGAGHLPHRQVVEAVLDRVSRFLTQ